MQFSIRFYVMAIMALAVASILSTSALPAGEQVNIDCSSVKCPLQRYCEQEEPPSSHTTLKIECCPCKTHKKSSRLQTVDAQRDS
ncbi:hypothetical protein BGZ76_011243 [Entomortierella beljakovae]|nr:hypothetical protein BGZ76_011243 [Entomortierella beljakovae]